jgi:hypothetical protein
LRALLDERAAWETVSFDEAAEVPSTVARLFELQPA